ncbi:MAG: family 2 glycosyl transferase, partial [Sulfolobales archaeon]
LMLKYNPTFFFFLASSLALIPGVVIIGYVAYKLLFYGVKHYVWALLGVTAGGVGLISLLIAIFALYMKRFEYRVLRTLRELKLDRRPRT